jgi:hypothetical protein
MFFRYLLIAGCLLVPSLGRQRPTEEKPEQKPPDEKQQEQILDKIPPKACSVPLLRVPTPAVPYMPKLMPKVSGPIRFVKPPAPPCEDEREGTPMSRKKEPKSPEAR